MKEKAKFQIETSKKSVRKYPNVIWFPRSKTDPKEIREVLKLALVAQKENGGTFNDKILGKQMTLAGSINIVGLHAEKYIETYRNKSIGDVSYITNARMLMRLFRFLGLVSRVSKGIYKVTDLGLLYAKFSGDFPCLLENENEEEILLNSLSNFSFYSINDDKSYRDGRFKMRPFVWLLNSLSVEPQCIFQLIVTTFSSKSENKKEIGRIRKILKELRIGKTSLAKEWRIAGLDPDDYSCVHNFYDSAKILVYLGSSLGLITKFADPIYGKKITGNAKQLKQATVFYKLTEKGKEFLNDAVKNELVFYEDLYQLFGDEQILQVVFFLASLNFSLGSLRVLSIKDVFFNKLFKSSLKKLLEDIEKKTNFKIEYKNDELVLNTNITFNFWQSIPPEIFAEKKFQFWYFAFISEIKKKKNSLCKVMIKKNNHQGGIEKKKLVAMFTLTDKEFYILPEMNEEKAAKYIKYQDQDDVYGGLDRFSSRISPTNSVFFIQNKIYIDNEKDALDLLIALRNPDENLRSFINKNIPKLIKNFDEKTSSWEKDQHYTWARNAFRLFGAEAIYSGSSGMLSRADVSISGPFISGIEVKSPRENRGTINTKAIRQAVDAKIQVADKYKTDETTKIAMAIGRRISPLAIKEENKWASEGQPVLLLNDLILYYLTLKTVDFVYKQEDLENLFRQSGIVKKENLLDFFRKSFAHKKYSKANLEKTKQEIDFLFKYIGEK